MAQLPSPSQTTNLRTSNDYGQFYSNPYEDPWAPSSLLQHPNTRKNKVIPRPGRTNEDYGDFYQDASLRTNIKSFLGGTWRRRGMDAESYVPSAHNVNPDWEQEKQVLRQQPGYVPPVVDGREPRVDPKRSAYDGLSRGSPRTHRPLDFRGPIRISPTLKHPLRSSLDDQRVGIHGEENVSPRWDFKVDPWKSEYRRHYLPDTMARNIDTRRLDQLTQRRGLGNGNEGYADPFELQGYSPSTGEQQPKSQ